MIVYCIVLFSDVWKVKIITARSPVSRWLVVLCGPKSQFSRQMWLSYILIVTDNLDGSHFFVRLIFMFILHRIKGVTSVGEDARIFLKVLHLDDIHERGSPTSVYNHKNIL